MPSLLPANDDVIVAIATPPGRGGIGVVRVSGKNIETIKSGILAKPVVARRVQHNSFLDAQGEIIDQGLSLYFSAPHSFTGEEVLELHGHGGPAVLQLIVQRSLDLGARLADPGEFTRRAFLNGKLDLVQAESVADLIDATSSEAARCAIRSLQGAFSDSVNAIVKTLINLRMLVEATLDFPEEEIDVLERADIDKRLKELYLQTEQILKQAKQGSLLREGFHVVLIGQPNVGKSSLLNCLAGDDIAIVTPIPGTTRDTIRQHIHLQGVPLHIIDTAGLHETSDEVEKIGIERTWKAINHADIIVLLMDATKGESFNDLEILRQLPTHVPRIYVFNKIDLISEQAKVTEDSPIRVYLSAKTGEGIDFLSKELLSLVGWRGDTEHGAFMARARHLHALEEAQRHLAKAIECQKQAEFLAEELKLTQNNLSTITGEFTSDDLLGEIFSRFCIGK